MFSFCKFIINQRATKKNKKKKIKKNNKQRNENKFILKKKIK